MDYELDGRGAPEGDERGEGRGEIFLVSRIQRRAGGVRVNPRRARRGKKILEGGVGERSMILTEKKKN